MQTGRFGLKLWVAAFLVFVAACSRYAMFPDTIEWDSENFSRATAWSRGGIAGAVYLAPGEKLPDADLQVGVILSTEHKTANDLQSWIENEYFGSGVSPMYNSNTMGDSCKVGLFVEGHATPRTSMMLLRCSTGTASAVCVESDEVLDSGTFTNCINESGCFEGVCDQRWLRDGDAMTELAEAVLSKR